MALTDPQKVKVTAEEKTLPRVVTGNYSSKYETEDGLIDLTLSTTESASNRKRHLARIDVNKITTMPFDETKKQEISMSAYVVIDRPVAGFTNAEAKTLVEGLVGFLSASTYSATTKLLGGES